MQNQEDCVSLEELEVQKLSGDYIECFSGDRQVERLKKELKIKSKEFEREKLIWAQEKEKVLR